MRRRGETSIGPRPAFQASDQSSAGTGSGPITRAEPAAHSRTARATAPARASGA